MGEIHPHRLGDGSSCIKYGFRTLNGDYLPAVGGGGRTTDTIHSDATRIGSWEQFRLTRGVYALPSGLG